METVTPTRNCAGCGALPAEAGDTYCAGCRSAIDRGSNVADWPEPMTSCCGDYHYADCPTRSAGADLDQDPGDATSDWYGEDY